MMKTEIKLIIRNLLKTRIVSLINISGLTIGLTFVILAGRYVYTEVRYDRFHDDYKRISRIERRIAENAFCNSPNVLFYWLQNNIPDIESMTRVCADLGTNVLYNNSKYNIGKSLVVDPEFFSVFSFELLSGELNSFTDDKFSVILSESTAYKIFNNKNPIGESLVYKEKPYTVKAILKDPPSNSSLKFDLLLSTLNLPDYARDNSWGNNTLQIFLKSNKETLSQELQQKANIGIATELKSLGYEKFADNIQFILNPLQDIYYSEGHDRVCLHGDKKYTLLLFGLSVLVLIIALINYTNFIIASITPNLKGVGIRSVTGASKKNNIRYLILQSALPFIIAGICAIVLGLLTEAYFEQTLAITLVEVTLPQVILIILGGLFLGVCVGLYPAFRLSSIKIADSLKAKNNVAGKIIHVRSSLSIVQFAATIALIISLFVINKQVNFVFKQNVENFDEEIVLYMPLEKRSAAKSQIVKTIQQTLKSLPEITETSTTNRLPGDEYYNEMRFSLRYNGEEKVVDVNHNWADAEFPKVMGYDVVDGRLFDKEIKSDYQSYIVNETFIRKYGIEDISKAFLNNSPIIGVLKDFHYNSLQKKIEPMAIRYENYYQLRLVARLASSSTESLAKVVKKMETVVNGVDKTAISDIQFLEEHVAALYEKEVRTSKIILVLSVFSILISCMGLFAISLFVTDKRTKEIGVRKVNGAKVSEILKMLNLTFVKWVLAAFIIACPIAYYAMNKWLENFAYKTNLSWWIFALAGVLALTIALLTVSWQSWRAATRNPVEALRYE